MSKEAATLLAVLKKEWFDLAVKRFDEAIEVVYFGTSAFTLKYSENFDVKIVLFKLKGRTEAVARADFVAFTDEKPAQRVTMSEEESFKPYKVYYGFGPISQLSPGIALSSLTRLSGKPVHNSVNGSCLVRPQGITDS